MGDAFLAGAGASGGGELEDFGAGEGSLVLHGGEGVDFVVGGEGEEAADLGELRAVLDEAGEDGAVEDGQSAETGGGNVFAVGVDDENGVSLGMECGGEEPLECAGAGDEESLHAGAREAEATGGP